ncbi:MAG: NosD domain-containing protein [Patescibacteria group bacterium]|nr:NosD domain-containing protein [Patescibacteria group bacterium]MDD5164893.1 NosD domain-containing protein [Patescibacteria group bacterium]MDD5534613.1 NosD domain-containing protein [Patescibacteria group bacterium]
MKKQFKILSILAICVILNFVLIKQACAETEVSGNITTDTTWTLANSPYIVTATAQVLGGVRLTIEPGATIKFNEGTGLNVGGELIARGTQINIINFMPNQSLNWGGVKFLDSSIDAVFDENGNYKNGSIIEYSNIEKAGYYSTVVGKRYAIDIDSASPFISKNTIVDNLSEAIWAMHSFAQITNNVISNNTAGITIIYDSPTIKNNKIFSNNNSGIHFYNGANPIITSNSIYDNNYGISTCLYPNPPKINNNNIFSNNYNIFLQNCGVFSEIDMTKNWWGTTDISSINSKIYDYYDDISLGKVNYEPYGLSELKFDGTDAFSSAPIVACTSFVYSDWSTCQSNGIQTRTVISSSPSSCTGGNPVLTQSCTYTSPTCTSWTYSDWSTCSTDGQQRRTVVSSFPLDCIGGNPILTQSCIYIPSTCISWIYSDWSVCQSNNMQNRSIIYSSPSGCSNGNPILTQSCTYIYTPPTCTSWTYSNWSACINNQQSRTMISSQPTSCIGGNPILIQTCSLTPACSENDWTSILTPTACPNNSQQTKTWYKIGQCQEGVTHPSTETISCNYQALTCTDFIYNDWSACGLSGVQSRTVFSSSPANCIGGNPILNQTCTYIPTCIANNWSCGNWSSCSSNGTQTRICNKILNCDGGVLSPATTQSCIYTSPEKQENIGSLSDGTLARIKGTAGVYLIYNNQKRPIKSAAVFLGRGYKWKNIIDVDANILNVYPTGSELTISEAINIVPKNQGIKIKINVPSLRVRSLPNASGKIITSVKSGKEYQVIEEQTGWYKINYSVNKTGWIMSQYTKIIK